MKSRIGISIGRHKVSQKTLSGFVLLLLVTAAVLLFRISKEHSRKPERNPLDLHSFPKRFLITGGAGFIGFHLAKQLSSHKKDLVVILDNFNDYYDVQLKISRAFHLDQLGVIVHSDDLCNDKFLHHLMTLYNFTHVLHLAAQAGVRYSVENPLAYVTANIECFLVLLEELKHFATTKLIYASSSSVYGKDSAIPFSRLTDDNLPGNMYAATKKANEILADHFCQLYKLRAVGLRPFTVYGPWGRPDMAIFKFAEHILSGKDVPLYQDSGKEPLSRDFTYVDDLIDGIKSAVDYEPFSCGEIFNLGLGHPVSVLDMIRIMEQELGVKANIKEMQLPATEILQTWADISDSVKFLNFFPKTLLEDGIKKFVRWYRAYLEDKLNSTLQEIYDKWFNRIEAKRIIWTTEY